MDEFFIFIAQFQRLAVLWTALAILAIIPFSFTVYPFSAWRTLALQLSNKVNRAGAYSQRQLAGALAALLLILPTIVLLLALQTLAWQPFLFELALLLLALDRRSSQLLTWQIKEALIEDNRPKARSALAPYVNRYTATLSALGIGKAGIETIALNFSRSIIVVLFWFGFAGGIGAILYRLTMELARTWSPSRQSFLPFGIPIMRFLVLLEWLPLRLFAFMLLIGSRFSVLLQQTRQQSQLWASISTSWLLCALGNKFQITLGGAVLYQEGLDKEYRMAKPSIGGKITPAAVHFSQVYQLLTERYYYWLALESGLLLMWALL